MRRASTTSWISPSWGRKSSASHGVLPVLGVHRQPGRRLAHVEGHGDQIESLLREELEHRREAVHGVRDLSRGGGERAGQGEERPVRERMAVEDEEPAGLVVRPIRGGATEPC